MRIAIVVLTLVFVFSSSFGQNSNSQNSNSGAMGGKIIEDKPAPARKKPVPKSAPNKARLSSPCGVYYENRADMSAASNASDKWFSLGQSAERHFWYNPHKTTCDPKTGVVKSWIREDHKNTDSNYAMVLYEFKCNANQMRVKTVIEYDKSGSVLETNNHDNDSWQDVAPGTAGEVILRTVCRRP